LGLREEQSHGFEEGHSPDFDEEVDGIAGFAGVGADPVILFYDHIAGFADETVVAVFEGLEGVAHGCEEGGEFTLAGAADVRRVPALEGVFFSGRGGHVRFSSGVA
jgi:hypothetical protein